LSWVSYCSSLGSCFTSPSSGRSAFSPSSLAPSSHWSEQVAAKSAAVVIGTESGESELKVTTQELSADEHSPKHLLEKDLLGRPKHGQERVSDLAARQDESAVDQPADGRSDNFEDEESR
jgi:hypothetical protein